jgi:uncharacterized DUF497 family protein
MDFEWDEAKRHANILKHGIDFVDAIEIFAGRLIETEDRRRDYGERRLVATGEAQEKTLRVVYTLRGDRCRIITARRARRDERRAYYASNPGSVQADEK